MRFEDAGLKLYLTEAAKHKQDYCQQLDELRADGTLAKISQKWFKLDATK